MDWLDLLAIQGTLKSLFWHHSSKVSILRRSAFLTVQLSHPYMTTGKTTALTRQTFVGKVMSLLFNMLSRLVITFLPRSKHLLISWLQSPSAVILEPPKIKSDTVSTVFPSISCEVTSIWQEWHKCNLNKLEQKTKIGREGRKEKKEEKKNGFLIKLRNLEIMPFPAALAPFSGRFLSMREGLPMVPESLVEGMTCFSRALNESSKVESHWLHWTSLPTLNCCGWRNGVFWLSRPGTVHPSANKGGGLT